MSLSIRIEHPGDAGGVRETNELAFGTPLEARLVDTLRAAAQAEACALRESFLSLVAAFDERVVGHILFTPVTIEPPIDRRIAGLAPMGRAAGTPALGDRRSGPIHRFGDSSSHWRC